jgi:hypothetical protein
MEENVLSEEYLDTIARKAISSGFVQLDDLAYIFVAEQNYRDIMPVLLELYEGPDRTEEIKKETRQERASTWTRLLWYWTKIPLFGDAGTIPYLNVDNRNLVKLEDLQEYLKSLRPCHGINLPLPTRLFPNFFRKEGDFWNVSFDGKTVRGIKHLIGMDYIEYLLEHPGRGVSASRFIRTPLTSEEGSRLGKMHEDQLEELRLSKSKSLRQGYKEKRSEEIVEQDRRSKEEFRKRITELEEIINDKESLGEEVWEAQKEKEDLIKELTASLDKSADKPRKAVSNAITRTINRMKKYHSSLAEHLKRNIHPGYSCIYTPPIDPNWNN